MTGRHRWVGAFAAAAATAIAHAASPVADTPGADIPTLRFAEMVRHPIGPRGIEATPGLTALQGGPVRLVGFIATQPAGPAAATLILAPQPVRLDDEDEGLADDLPAIVVYLHPAEAAAAADAGRCAGPVRAVGTLELGPRREADDRISYIRLAGASLQCLAAAAPAR